MATFVGNEIFIWPGWFSIVSVDDSGQCVHVAAVALSDGKQ